MFIVYILTFVSVLVSIAFYTVVERKVLAGIQRRVGPNYYTPYMNVFQGFFDGIKLLESTSIPKKVTVFYFLFAPIGLFSVNILLWLLVPFFSDLQVINFDSPILLLMSFISLSPFFTLLAGLSSRNSYAYMGSLRSVALMFSYELVFSLMIFIICFISGGFSFEDVIIFQRINGSFFVLTPFLAVIFLIFILVETNRAPFDLAEAESELVAGFHVEYSGFLFALFFLAEYGFMLLHAHLFSIFFLAGWDSFCFLSKFFFILKVLFVLFFFLVVRASLPRLRIDSLLSFSWRKVLPFLCNYLLMLLMWV